MKVVSRYLKSILIQLGMLKGMACYADQLRELIRKENAA